MRFKCYQVMCEKALLNVVNNKKEALEYISKLPKGKTYTICKVHYKKADVLSMLRMFCGVVPLDCSFESNIEKDYYKNIVKKQQQAMSISNKIKEQLESLGYQIQDFRELDDNNEKAEEIDVDSDKVQ